METIGRRAGRSIPKSSAGRWGRENPGPPGAGAQRTRGSFQFMPHASKPVSVLSSGRVIASQQPNTQTAYITYTIYIRAPSTGRFGVPCTSCPCASLPAVFLCIASVSPQAFGLYLSSFTRPLVSQSHLLLPTTDLKAVASGVWQLIVPPSIRLFRSAGRIADGLFCLRYLPPEIVLTPTGPA